MEHSLSVILPVYNVQSTLETTVLRWIEVLPELTRRFDLWIVDDGSTDYTPEVANDLAARFPQVRMTRHATRRGLAASLRTGLSRSSGEVVLCRDEDCALEPSVVSQLWQRVDERDVIFARHTGHGTSNWSAWLPAGWHANRPAAISSTSEACLRMARRSAMENLLESEPRDSTVLVVEVSSRGCRWHEAHVPGATAEPTSAESPRKRVSHRGRLGKVARADQAGSQVSQSKGPNYLAKLKDFALGE